MELKSFPIAPRLPHVEVPYRALRSMKYDEVSMHNVDVYCEDERSCVSDLLRLNQVGAK